MILLSNSMRYMNNANEFSLGKKVQSLRLEMLAFAISHMSWRTLKQAVHVVSVR
jgi:hypothetical protein